MSKDKIIKNKRCQGSVKGITFLEYFKELNLKRQTIVLLDNASIHKTKELREYCKDRDIELLFTPPYSPWFNPIELYFSNVKRQYYKTQLIEESLNSVSPLIIGNFFEKSINCDVKF
jgi:transposase